MLACQSVHSIWASLCPPLPLQFLITTCFLFSSSTLFFLFLYIYTYIFVIFCLPTRLRALWIQGLHLSCSPLCMHCLVHSTYLLMNVLGGSQFPIYVADQTFKMKDFQQYITPCTYICYFMVGWVEGVYVTYGLILLRKILTYLWVCKTVC